MAEYILICSWSKKTSLEYQILLCKNPIPFKTLISDAVQPKQNQEKKWS